MRQMGIRAQWSKPWTITTKDSDFSTELQNILDEQFDPDRPNAVWCSDITYIWTIDGFVYLTSIMDLYSGKIIAWTLSETLEVSCVVDTINKAKARRETDQPLIIHSDRGSQYVAKEYKKATEKMQRSYSKKAKDEEKANLYAKRVRQKYSAARLSIYFTIQVEYKQSTKWLKRQNISGKMKYNCTIVPFLVQWNRK